jgi:HAMP domain-containing protein
MLFSRKLIINKADRAALTPRARWAVALGSALGGALVLATFVGIQSAKSAVDTTRQQIEMGHPSKSGAEMHGRAGQAEPPRFRG